MNIHTKPMESTSRASSTPAELLDQEQRARAAAEAALQHCRDLVQEIDAIIWEADATTLQFTFVNDRAEEILGYPVQQWLTEPNFWVNHLFPEDRERTLASCRAFTSAAKSHWLEYRMVSANGTVVWLRDNVRVIWDREGKAKQLRGMMVDITDRKQAEDALRESEARYRRILDTAYEGITTTDAAGRTNYANQRLSEMLGYTVQEILALPRTAFLFEEDRARAQELLERRKQGIREQYEFRARRKDGSELWALVSANPILDEKGEFLGSFLMLTDITERVRAERELEQRLGQLEVIYRLTNAVNCAERIEAIYSEALDCLECALGVDRSSILLFDANGVMRFKAWRGLSETYRQAVEGHTPWGPDAVNPQPVLVPDVEEDPELDAIRPVIRSEGIRALSFIPLISRGRLLGKFMLYYDKPHLFSSEELRLAQTIAGQVAFAIERKQAEDALRDSEARYRRIVDTASEGIWVLDPAGRTMYANQQMAEVLGYRVEEMLGRPALDFLFPEEHARWLDGFERRRQGIREQYEIRARRKDGSEVWGIVSTNPIFDDQNTFLGSLGMFTDVTERKRAEDALRFLVDAGNLLASSIDYETTLASIARLLIPVMADWCIVDIVEDGAIRRVAMAAADPNKERLLRELQLRYPPDWDSPHPASRVLRSGEPEVLTEVTDAVLAAHTCDEEHYALVRKLETRSHLAVPLITRDGILGAISLAYAESGRHYGPSDLRLAEELARRAALAIDKARLYRRQKEIALTLQESLLPPQLPEIPGVEIAACYRPAYEGSEVGGDFYDLFETPDHAWAIVIGDVTGKGPAAASITALVRHTTHALAMRARTPSVVLSGVNDAILRHGAGDRWCTVAYIHLKMTDGGTRLLVTSGGHPLPLLLHDDGRVEPLGRPGMILGAFPDAELTDQAANLKPGDAVILYTDGVTEARRSHELFGDDRLQAVLETCAGLDAHSIKERIEHAVMEFQGGVPRDDIAILVLRIRSARTTDEASTGSRTSQPRVIVR